MQANTYKHIYIANVASEPSRKKAVQEARLLQAEIKRYFSQDSNIKVVTEGKEGQVWAFDLLNGQSPSKEVVMLHFMSERPISDRWYLNTSGGRRKAINGDSIQFEELSNLQLVILDGGASLESVEQLLFAGIPQVLVLSQHGEEAKDELLRQHLYESLSKGMSFEETYSFVRNRFPERFRLQEIPQDPFQYWEVKEEWEKHADFPEGMYYLSTSTEILALPLGAAAKAEAVLPSLEQEVLPSVPSGMYFCTQELKGLNTPRFLDYSRLEETLQLSTRTDLWPSQESASHTVIERTPDPVASESPAESTTHIREDSTESEATHSSVIVVQSARQVSEAVDTQQKVRPQNDNAWIDQLVDQYRRRFTISLPRSYKRGVAAVSLAAVLVMVFSVLTWKQMSKSEAVEQALQSELYNQQTAFITKKTYNVLLLPFRSHLDCVPTESYFESGIVNQINSLQASEDIGLRVAYVHKGFCPQNADEAREIAQEHQADLIIWGDYRKVAGDADEVVLRYLSMEERYQEMSSLLREHIGKQALSEDLKQGTFAGHQADISKWIMGFAQLHAESYRNALSYLNEIDNKDEYTSSVIHHMMAKCYQGLSLDDKALQSYNEAICLNPENAGAFHSRGRFYQQQRRIDLAVYDLEKVMELEPKHNKAKMLAGMLKESYTENAKNKTQEPVNQKTLLPNLDTAALLAEMDTPLSLPRPQELLAKESDRKNITKLLAEKEAELAAEQRRRNREKMQQLMTAVNEYTQFIRQYPDKASLYHQRGVAYEMLKQESEALADFSHAIRLDPGLMNAYLDRAALYVSQSDNEKALADYNEALRLSPQNADVYAVRAELLRKLGRYASAENDARKAITLDPGNRRYQRLLGRISEELTSY
ncbi:MAG: tetratricopeptide repeat protein [Bacteroidota bacterium]